jgi:hypothetical protein
MLIGSAKPEALKPAPVTIALEIVTALVPPFCKVIVCEPLVPAVTVGKLALMGIAESCGWGVFVGGGVTPPEVPPLAVEFDPMTTPAQPLPISEAANTSATKQFAVWLTCDQRPATPSDPCSVRNSDH